ncbi:peptidoglycan DD-metalloendopeptidase family protein [Methylonatrum kenyense]|uniref:murein hydrolase activator EnvC family protein n=1 Tax=Methylonatrum kenyense TaxID=455253 RepID=UPI0020BD9C91|nr:peptidoglycan DD-metalloendopeptidase family protein [Methylonatrum kenyense]MCK8515278.1 peptidoglycan DD-metalloendopeptidase family protein [Methylonatrum kenyense]
MRAIRRLLLCGLLLASPVVPADTADIKEREQQLEQLRGEIERIERDLDAQRAERDAVAEEQRRLEQSVSRSVRRGRELQAEAEQVGTRISELEQQQAEQEENAEAQREQLAEEIRAVHRLGAQPALKLLLNQEDPAELGRMLVYLERLGAQREQRVQEAVAMVAELRASQEELAGQRQQLDQLRQEQDEEAERLARRRDERAELQARLDAEIASEDARLARMAEDEQELQALLDELHQALAEIPQQDRAMQPFDEQRGGLRWPLQGEVMARYGSSRGRSGDRWRGLLLAADRGTPVTAVANGQVVFANWLRGQGLLMIIDHGDGHMTLYGNNDSLYRDVGEWVEAGDVIASSGDTGAGGRSALYFELRVGGEPRDPMTWLRAAED